MTTVLYGLKDAWRRRASFWLRIAGLIAFSTGASTFAAVAQSLEATAQADVSEHWRGAYDLLVRPAYAQLELEQQTGVVEGNYLAIPHGGITIDQYRQIAALVDVEAAAPVAPVGYLPSDTGAIGLELPNPEPNTLYRIEVLTRMSDGLPDGVSRRDVAYLASGGANWWVDLFHEGPLATDVIGTGSGGVYLNVAFLPPQWTLVAGIDPAQEAALVGLDRMMTEGHYLEAEERLSPTYDEELRRPATAIPLIISHQSYLEIQLEMRVTALPLDDREAVRRLNRAQVEGTLQPLLSELDRRMDGPEGTVVLDQVVEAGDILQPLRGWPLTFRPGMPVGYDSTGSGLLLDRDVMLYPAGSPQYSRIAAPRLWENPLSLQILALGTWGEAVRPIIDSFRPSGMEPSFARNLPGVAPEAPVFRPLTAYEPPPFVLSVWGVYDFARLAPTQDPLTYVPLGIYEPPLAVLRYDESGQPIEPRVITPDVNPAGFIPRPPLALTTLQGAEFLLGRSDFISAIRIRVAGVEAYTADNLAKIERVAGDIAQLTGLHVDMVAGSSPQRVLVNVPMLGYVEERWTTLGAAVEVTHGINSANLILLACLLAATGLYVTNLSQLALVARRWEIGLLKAVGWRKREMITSLVVGAASLGLLAGVLGALGSVALSLALGLQPALGVIGAVTLGAPVLYSCAAAFPILAATQRAPAALLGQGEVEPFRHIRGRSAQLHATALALRQIWRRRLRTLLAGTIVAAGVSLALILVHIIVFLHGRLRVTLLGELVSLHVRGYHILMTLSALVMGGLATLETLLLSVTERAAELGLLKAVGWKSRHIFTTVMLEGVLIAAQGGAAGAAVALLLIWLLSGNVMPQAWWMAGLGLAGAAALGALGAAYPAWRAQGLAPARALTGTRDAFQVKVDRLKTRQWLAGVGLAALAVAVFALLGGRKDVVLEPLGTALRPEPTLHPAVQLFSADRMLVDAESIAAFGPRDPASPGAAQAADAIAEAFESAGLQVRRQPVPLPVVDVFPSGGGQPVLTLGIRPVEVSCVALSFPGSGDEEPITGPVLFVRQGSAWPSADEVSGRVLVVEDPAMDLGMFYQDLYRHYGIPAPYEAALCVREREPGAMEVLERQEGLRAQVRMTENVEGFLPGDEAPDREIWLVVHYDTLPRSPGAEASASGTAVLMELARVLSGVGSPISVRFIAMGGSGTGLEGAVTRLQESPVEASNVVGVLVLERLGGWRQLSVAADAALREPSQAAGAEDFLRPYWMQCLDVGRVGAMDWLRREEATSARAAGAPPVLLDSALKAGQSLEIEIERQGDPCGGMYAAFLYRGLPAVELCGLGNDLVSTPYDTIVGLQGNRLLQAVVVAYQMIQSWLGGN